MSECYQTLLENNRMLVESNAMLNNKIMKILTKNKLLENQILEMNFINENYRETQIDNLSKIQKYKKENSKLKEQHEILSKTISENFQNHKNCFHIVFKTINTSRTHIIYIYHGWNKERHISSN